MLTTQLRDLVDAITDRLMDHEGLPEGGFNVTRIELTSGPRGQRLWSADGPNWFAHLEGYDENDARYTVVATFDGPDLVALNIEYDRPDVD